ncbi:hypothetical protein QBK99_02515 [Corticibacterium sp. UT-5YL-CI-8]|nr:hypothetical protein [Tianweitania sp. UT-5YL-CI-8]
MISFSKKADSAPKPAEKANDNRFDKIKKEAADKRKKSEADNTVRPAPEAPDSD